MHLTTALNTQPVTSKFTSWLGTLKSKSLESSCFMQPLLLRAWIIFYITFVFEIITFISETYSMRFQGLVRKQPALTRLRLASSTTLAEEVWLEEAYLHVKNIEEILYPSYSAKSSSNPNSRKKYSSELKVLNIRTHLVYDNPIYNFLHSYYRYSALDLKKYSPGLAVILEGARLADHSDILNEKFMEFNAQGGEYHLSKHFNITGEKINWIKLARDREVLRNTTTKAPFFGCFGMHEWAMLYSGGSGKPIKRHQESVPLRVSQETIDSVVGQGQLRCTHFDAWRFFQPSAKPLNAINPLARETQPRYEQPGCIHANMDLFRYAYQLYPYVSSKLLLDALKLALQARKIDMRASPYDVSAYEDCETPLCVETPQGRKLYIEEQEKVATAAAPIRLQILEVYDRVFDVYTQQNLNNI